MAKVKVEMIVSRGAIRASRTVEVPDTLLQERSSAKRKKIAEDAVRDTFLAAYESVVRP